MRGQLHRGELCGRVDVGAECSMLCAVCACLAFSYGCGCRGTDRHAILELEGRSRDWRVDGK